jgi:hypothetical protein
MGEARTLREGEPGVDQEIPPQLKTAPVEGNEWGLIDAHKEDGTPSDAKATAEHVKKENSLPLGAEIDKIRNEAGSNPPDPATTR